MSQVRGTEVDGDVAVGRHVTTGGNATVRGGLKVGKNLTVDGWLEARNIKGANKGIYASVEALRESHPRPHDGWFAGVPATAEEVTNLGLAAEEGRAWFRMYIGRGGEWVCEPIDKLYEITVDNNEVERLREETERLQDSVDDLREEILETVGQPDGIAPLDSEGLIAKEHMPGGYASRTDVDSSVDALKDATGVLPFAGSVYRLEEVLGERWGAGDVAYCVSLRLFIKRTEKGWEYAPGYNKAYERGIRSDVVYRCGRTLYCADSDGEGSAGEEERRAVLTTYAMTAELLRRPEAVTVTEAEYEALEAEGLVEPDKVYYILDDDQD